MPYRRSRIPRRLSRKEDHLLGDDGGPKLSARNQTTALHLADASELSYFSYYRCSCGHRWAVHKEQPSVICHITPLPQKPKTSSVK